MTATYDLDVVVTRGDSVESVHRVSAAVVRRDELVASAGDAGLRTYWRSCAKPFQILPFVESGGFDEVGWDADEMALACASHGGEPEHVAIAERMLSGLGLEEGDLACGVAEPLAPRGARLLREAGARPTRLHNNCSGKHAAMLARAQTADWSIEGYHRLDHPVQQAILAEVARWTGERKSNLDTAIDGCGVVVFGSTLTAMARAYARLGAAYRSGDATVTRVVGAMLANPFLVGGTDRFDTIFMEETPGILCKIGAEGVHCCAVPETGLGIALKVEDGSARAQYPALLALLQIVGAVPASLPQRLAEIARKPVRDTRHDLVGEIIVRARI